MCVGLMYSILLRSPYSILCCCDASMVYITLLYLIGREVSENRNALHGLMCCTHCLTSVGDTCVICHEAGFDLHGVAARHVTGIRKSAN